MSPSVNRPESMVYEARFGARFRDMATGQYVEDGLVVDVWHPNQPALRQRAFVNPSSVWVVGELRPRMPELQPEDPLRRFHVEVRDARERFLPCRFQVALPSRRLLTLECAPDTPLFPTPPEPAIPLFSAPARQASPGLAVARAELWDTQADAPAAWALLELHVRDRRSGDRLLARGMADDQGRAALFFDYPGILQDAPLREQSWPLLLQAFYTPLPAAPLEPRPRLPELCATLRQRPAWLSPDTSGPQSRQLELTLRYGQPLVVRTQQDPHSRLRLTPAGS